MRITLPLVLRFALFTILGCSGGPTVPAEIVRGTVEIDRSAITDPFGLGPNGSYQLTARAYTLAGELVSPQPTLEFNTSNPLVVTVSPTGLVLAQQPGEARVRVQVMGSIEYRADSIGVFVIFPLSQ